MMLSNNFVTKTEIKKVTGTFLYITFSCDETGVQAYRIIGVATAVGDESMTSPAGASGVK